MPIQYSNPINPYVNRGSVEVAKLLSSKFANNFQFADQLQDSLANLQVADFEGDLAAKMQLEQRTRQELEGFAARGDYENLMVPITRSAQQFAKDYTPLAQNYKLYEEAKKIEQERVMRGDVTQDQYENWMRRSKYINDPTTGDLGTYRGVKFNADGSVDNSSYFAHIPIAKAVNVDEEILKAINTLDPEKRGGRSATNFVQGQDGIRYVVDSEGEIIEQITPDRVAAVTRQVLDRSDVRSYLEQEADFGTFEATPDELQMILSQRLETISGKPSHTQHAQELRTVLQSGNTGQMRQMAKKVLQDQDAERYMDMAIRAGATTSRYGGGSRQRIDSDYYSYLQNAAPDPVAQAIVIPGQPQTATPAAADPNTKIITPQSIEKTRENIQTERVAAIRAIERTHPNLLAPIRNLNFTSSEQVGGMSDAALRQAFPQANNQEMQALMQFRNIHRNIASKERAINDFESAAKEASGYTPKNAVNRTIIDAATERGVQAEQLGGSIIADIRNEKGVNQEQAIRIFAENFLNEAENSRTGFRGLVAQAVGGMGQYLVGDMVNPAEATKYLKTILVDTFGLDEADAGKVLKGLKPVDHGLSGVAEVLNPSTINSNERAAAGAYAEQLEQASKVQVGFGASTQMFGDPTGGKASKKLTEEIQSYPASQFTHLTDRYTGTPIAELVSGEYSISDVKFTHVVMPDNTVSTNALQLTFKPGSGSDGENVTVAVPYAEAVQSFNVAGQDVYSATNMGVVQKTLDAALSYKINNPLARSARIVENFATGTLVSEFIFNESGVGGGVKAMDIIGVNSQFTNTAGNRYNVENAKLESWADFYIDASLQGIFQ